MTFTIEELIALNPTKSEPQDTFQSFVVNNFEAVDNTPLFLPILMDGKKPIGSKNNLTHQELNDVHTNKQVKLKDGSIYKLRENFTHFELRLKYTDNIVCVDVDGILNNGDCCLTDVWSIPFFKEYFLKCPYTLSRNKELPHFYFKLDGLDRDGLKDTMVDCFNHFKGDLLLNHCWEKKDNNKIYNYKDELPYFHIDDLKHMFKPNAFDKRQKTTSPVETASNSSDLEKIVDLITTDYLDNYSDWTKILWGAKNSGISEDFMRTISKKSTKYSDDGFDNVWSGQCNDVKEGTIRYYAKLSNETAYYTIAKEENYFISIDTLKKGSRHVAEVISTKLEKHLKFSNNKWIMFNKKTNLWMIADEPAYLIVQTIHKHIDFSIQKKIRDRSQSTDEGTQKQITEEIQSYAKMYDTVDKTGFYSMFSKHLKTILKDDDFYGKLDNNPYEVVFEDGIYNAKENKFVAGFNEDNYITQTIPSKYTIPTEEELSYVKEVLFKICNCNQEHVEYYLDIIGQAMLGDPELEKALYFCVGVGGDNGKTTIFDTATDIMPNYVSNIERKTFEEGYAKSHKHLTGTKGKRIVYVEEMSTKKQNIELLKQIGDGKKIKNEVMFGTDELINISYQLFFLSNCQANLRVDGGIGNRYRQVCHNANFGKDNKEDDYTNLKFIQDRELSSKLRGQYKHALIHLFLQHAHKYTQKKSITIPTDFREAIEQTLESNDEVKSWFNDCCEYGADFKCSKIQIEEHLQKPLREIQTEIQRITNIKYNKAIRVPKYTQRGGWLGFRIKETEPECMIP